MARSGHCAHVHREVIVNGNDEEVEGVPPLVETRTDLPGPRSQGGDRELE